jgi:hypothetical protein
MFADPVADLAVLGRPDNQVLCDQCDAYEAFTDELSPIEIAEPEPLPFAPDDPFRHLQPTPVQRAWWLRLSDQWAAIRVQAKTRGVFTVDDEVAESGMSGSPIVNDEGKAVAVVSLGNGFPRLARELPVWLVRELGTDPGQPRSKSAVTT